MPTRSGIRHRCRPPGCNASTICVHFLIRRACPRTWITSNYVLVETVALLQRRFGLDAVRDLEARLVPLLAVRWIDQPLHARAMERMRRANRRGLSLVDCTSFTLMDADGIEIALALAQDSLTEGYRVLPAPHAGPARDR